MIAATEYMADMTLNSAKFALCGMVSNITSRHLLWLRHWQANMKTKWRLAAALFKGGSLFGEALDPVLVEGRDKKKVLPFSSRRYDRRSTFPYRRQSFRSAEYGFQAPTPARQFAHKSDKPQKQQSFRDRTRQSQGRRPFRGSGFHPYRRK